MSLIALLSLSPAPAAAARPPKIIELHRRRAAHLSSSRRNSLIGNLKPQHTRLLTIAKRSRTRSIAAGFALDARERVHRLFAAPAAARPRPTTWATAFLLSTNHKLSVSPTNSSFVFNTMRLLRKRSTGDASTTSTASTTTSSNASLTTRQQSTAMRRSSSRNNQPQQPSVLVVLDRHKNHYRQTRRRRRRRVALQSNAALSQSLMAHKLQQSGPLHTNATANNQHTRARALHRQQQQRMLERRVAVLETELHATTALLTAVIDDSNYCNRNNACRSAELLTGANESIQLLTESPESIETVGDCKQPGGTSIEASNQCEHDVVLVCPADDCDCDCDGSNNDDATANGKLLRSSSVSPLPLAVVANAKAFEGLVSEIEAEFSLLFQCDVQDA